MTRPQKITVLWYDSNRHCFTHGYLTAGPSLHGVVDINGNDFPTDADIIATIEGHVKTFLWDEGALDE